MILPLNINVSNTYQRKNCIKAQGTSELGGFPIAFFGENSYLVSSKIHTLFDHGKNIKYYSEELEYTHRFAHNIQVGKYCGLAHDIDFVLAMNHNFNNFFQNSVLSPDSKVKKKESRTRRKGQILIQNDVWVGLGVTIMSGVKIGNGAIIGAKSVVTKDVEPYSIVAGNPAKHIRYRFDKEIIDKLQMIQWWYWDYDKIEDSIENFNNEIEKFIDYYYDEAVEYRNKIKNHNLYIPTDKKNFIYFEDSNEKFSTYEQVIKGFVDYYKNDENVRLIIYTYQEQEDNIIKLLEQLDGKCEIFLYYQIEELDETAVFKYGDYYITNRTDKVVYHSCYADVFGLKTISGVDIPLFCEKIL